MGGQGKQGAERSLRGCDGMNYKVIMGIQAYLGDTVGLAADHLNKANFTIK